MLRQTDPIWQVQWHRGRKKKKNREWVKKGEWEKQTWRWLWWWCCPVLRGCSPVLWWPRVRGRRGHVVKTRWVHSWNTDGQQNFYYFFKDAVWRSQGVAACLYNYLHNKKDKEKKQDTDRERGTAWFAPRGCTFLTYVQRDKKKSALTYKCKKTRLQTISTLIMRKKGKKKVKEIYKIKCRTWSYNCADYKLDFKNHYLCCRRSSVESDV